MNDASWSAPAPPASELDVDESLNLNPSAVFAMKSSDPPDSRGINGGEPPTPGAHDEAAGVQIVLEPSQAGQLKGLEGKSGVGQSNDLRKNKPLRLLDLPMDVLREIVRRVTHTNDLASLALTHSALHRLVIPHIYSRFDIVWPDAHSVEDANSGVDALTFGLATLVMGEEVFGGGLPDVHQRGPASQQALRLPYSAVEDTHRPEQQRVWQPTVVRSRLRKGNHYARYTRKFSLGNGPADMVAEYLITKESGKMLGTLVALAVARMPVLETFVWDMPTGILRDVWLALSSLADRRTEGGCRLKNVWVRWHDNSQAILAEGNMVTANSASTSAQTPTPAGGLGTVGPIATPLSVPATAATAHHASVARVERPNFSILPPLESLTVLDIDELAYLDEMSVLIESSQHRLRELRVGIASRAVKRDWVKNWDGDDLIQVDPEFSWLNSRPLQIKRLGGVLGVLFGHIHDLKTKNTQKRATGVVVAAESQSNPNQGLGSVSVASDGVAPPSSASLEIPVVQTAQTTAAEVDDPSNPIVQGDHIPTPLNGDCQEPIQTTLVCPPSSAATDGAVAVPMHDRGSPEMRKGAKLKLKLLELERVPLCIPALQGAIDWTILTDLTILNCLHHERLWKCLRGTFRPAGSSSTLATPAGHNPRLGTRFRNSTKCNPKAGQSTDELIYPLRLKKFYTDAVSPTLINFLQDTLAPDSLEVLFLQEGQCYVSAVPIGAIYKGPLKRHRKSLQKVLIDSTDRSFDGRATNGRKWTKWMFTHDVLAFVVSGKMTCLRELGMALDFKDWHYFLQRLPWLPQLRSLYVTHITHPAHPHQLDSKELALQVVDIVALRPEIELCYLAIADKCFEIIEGKPSKQSGDGSPSESQVVTSEAGDTMSSENDDSGADDEDDEDEDDMVAVGELANDASEAESDLSSQSRADSEDGAESMISDEEAHVSLKLREILFYDEKVAVFKARHGRL